MQTIPLGLLVLLLSAPAFAELYQWQDENGRTHFSDKEPGNKTKVNTLPKPSAQSPSGRKASSDSGNGAPASAQERQQRVLQVMKQEAELREQERLSAENERMKREAECNSLRTRQSSMDGRRLFRRNSEEDGGGIRYIDGAERAAYEQQIRDAIAEKCP